MNQLRYPTLILLAGTVIGCDGSNDQSNKNANNSMTQPVAGVPKKISPQGDDAIRSGYGTEQVHVGVPIGELTNDWIKVGEVGGPDFMQNKNLGIEVEHRDGRVETVIFNYIGRGVAAYKGKTAKEITADSTLIDVRSKYGDPSYISQSRHSEFGEFPGALEVVAGYVEDGIQFSFVDDKLASIIAMKPRADFDYEGFKVGAGDTLIYIRPEKASPKVGKN